MGFSLLHKLHCLLVISMLMTACGGSDNSSDNDASQNSSSESGVAVGNDVGSDNPITIQPDPDDVQPSPGTSTYFGMYGNIAGLDGDLVLSVGGVDHAFSSSGSFSVANVVEEAGSLTIRVVSAPSHQSCRLGSDSRFSNVRADITGVQIDCENLRYRLGGEITGLDGTLVLAVNDQQVSISQPGDFRRNGLLEHGTDVALSIVSAPDGQTCSIESVAQFSSVEASIDTVQIQCQSLMYSISGQVTGLDGDVQISVLYSTRTLSNGAFTITDVYPHGASVVLRLSGIPDNQVCDVVGGHRFDNLEGDITGIEIACSPKPYDVEVIASGIDGEVVIQVGDIEQTILSSGRLEFEDAVLHGEGLALSVLSTPTGYVCTFSEDNFSSVIADISDISLVCELIQYNLDVTVEGLDGDFRLVWPNGMDEQSNVLADNPDAISYTIEDIVVHGEDLRLDVFSMSEGQVCVLDSASVITDVETNLSASISCSSADLLRVQTQIDSFYTGEGISGIAVSGIWYLSGGGEVTAEAMTGPDGLAVLQGSGVASSDRLVVSASGAGYSPSSIVVEQPADRGSIELELELQISSNTLTGSASSTITFDADDHRLVEIAANTMITESGDLVTGEVAFDITVLDASRDPEILPLNYGIGYVASDGLTESYGALSVIAQQNYESVYIADGSTIRLGIPVADNASATPQEADLFYFDTSLGHWVQRGTATLISTGVSPYYQADVDAFGIWGVGRVYDSIVYQGCLVDETGSAVDGAVVSAQGRDFIGLSQAVSDASGDFSIYVRENSEILLQASSGGQYAARVLVSDDTDMVSSGCILLEPAEVLVTLTWGESPSDLDSRFGGISSDGSEYFHVSWRNTDEELNGETIDLDVDDVSSFGPEVITMTGYPFDGVYQYGVHRFSSSGSISSGEARISLDVAGNNYRFVPPEGAATDCWVAFKLRVTGGVAVVETTNEWAETTVCNNFGGASSVSSVSALSVGRTAQGGETQPQAPESKFYVK